MGIQKQRGIPDPASIFIQNPEPKIMLYPDAAMPATRGGVPQPPPGTRGNRGLSFAQGSRKKSSF